MGSFNIHKRINLPLILLSVLESIMIKMNVFKIVFTRYINKIIIINIYYSSINLTQFKLN